MSNLFPEGLTKSEFDSLSRCASQAADIPIADLLIEAEEHVRNALIASEQNCMVNVAMAEGLLTVIRRLADDWVSIPAHAEPWCKGMIRYFTLCGDDENDFSSPIGFDDDAEVINACLRLAERSDLCINPEDFDDV